MLEILRPHLLAHHLTDVDSDALQARGIRGVIIDMDNTLTPWRSLEITPEVTTWVAHLRALGLMACVVSNAATARRVQPVADQLGIPWVTRAIKPLARGFQQGMQKMGTTPETTAIIGDQLFTDILGGNRLSLYTILVDPTSPREALITILLQRPLERLVGRTAIKRQ